MNDAMSAERCDRAPYSRSVIVRQVASTIIPHDLVSGSPASVTRAQANRVERTKGEALHKQCSKILKLIKVSVLSALVQRHLVSFKGATCKILHLVLQLNSTLNLFLKHFRGEIGKFYSLRHVFSASIFTIKETIWWVLPVHKLSLSVVRTTSLEPSH